MRITEEEVATTAVMARLALRPAERERMASELSQILSYVAELAAIDVTGVPPTTHPVPSTSSLRLDQVEPHLDTEEALRAAPARDGRFFVVPSILDHGSEP